jgi:hypothetical protein
MELTDWLAIAVMLVLQILILLTLYLVLSHPSGYLRSRLTRLKELELREAQAGANDNSKCGCTQKHD